MRFPSFGGFSSGHQSLCDLTGSLLGGWIPSMSLASLVAQTAVKNLPAIQENRVQSLGREDPLEKDMATLFSILAWRIPWTEEPGRLQSIMLHRVGHD